MKNTLSVMKISLNVVASKLNTSAGGGWRSKLEDIEIEAVQNKAKRK